LYGEIIEDRGSQITFSALGQNAPAEIKYAWDPTRSKREAIANAIRKKIPEFDVRVGGATSVDITRKGVNKAYGIMKMAQYLNLTIHDIVFVGDALFYGGNDYPAKTTGVDCVSVKGPEETANLIRSWLA
jgi:HAD superfamily hydrolase (TIGR01484 family)